MTQSMSSRGAAASRARGALVLAIFGGLWLAGGESLYANFSHAPLGEVALAGLVALAAAAAIILAAWRTDARLKPWAEPWDERTRRVFMIVNAAQYAGISLAILLLARGAYQQWLIPALIAVVGLHFLPLARLFASPPHAWIGLAMLAAAALVAALRLPPLSPVGVFAGGAVLLAGALLLTRIAARGAKLAEHAAG